jgi:membrane protease subunit HflK
MEFKLRRVMGPDGRRLPSLRRLLWVLPLVLVPWLLFSSYFTVPADSVGLVQRWGRFTRTEGSGLHFKLPFGIEAVELVAVERQLKLEFGFGTPGATNPEQIGGDPARERSMVTGDLNAALVEWVVQYKIGDPVLFLFHVRDPASTLRDLAEAVMREIIGDRTVDEVITVGRGEIESSGLVRLRELTTKYQLGLTVDQLQLVNVNPPRDVQASFNEVNKAQQDRENLINVANGEYNKAVPRAQGDAAQKISIAEGYKLKRVNEALGDVAAFNAVLEQYLKAPAVTRQRIYLETMAEVLPQLHLTVVDDKVTQLLPLLQAAAPAAPAAEVRK